jgi:hypothetical protein
MTNTSDPHRADFDQKPAPDRPPHGLMSFRAFLRLNGGFGAAKAASDRKTD